MSIRVLIVDYDPAVREMLTQVIGSAHDIQIVGYSTTGPQLIQIVKTLNPQVVVIDMPVPHIDTIVAIREIMDLCPLPIVVVCTSATLREPDYSVDATKAGALTVVQRPDSVSLPNYESVARELIGAVRAMSSVQVIRHARSGHGSSSYSSGFQQATRAAVKTTPEIVAIVASTGGPRTVGEIVGHLPLSFRLPIIIVQHITFDFVNPMISWLNTFSTLPVRIANSNESPDPGTIYFAPGRVHVRLSRDHRFELSDVPNNVPHIPSGDILFESVARSYGPSALGIILTGMGNDGAQGLRSMYDAGAMTIAQEGSSCVVFGMPQEAIMLGAARQTLTPAQIAEYLLQYAS